METAGVRVNGIKGGAKITAWTKWKNPKYNGGYVATVRVKIETWDLTCKRMKVNFTIKNVKLEGSGAGVPSGSGTALPTRGTAEAGDPKATNKVCEQNKTMKWKDTIRFILDTMKIKADVEMKVEGFATK